MFKKIFINYRRDDSAGTAGRLQDRLALTFGRRNVFIDVEGIPAGEDFKVYVHKQVSACNVMLVVIGSSWINSRNEAGERRLEQTDDVVAFEIATALAASHIRVIPVLIDTARMPRESDLPENLKPLAFRSAIQFRNAYFDQDADMLAARIRNAPQSGSWKDHLVSVWQSHRLALLVVATATLLACGAGAYWLITVKIQSEKTAENTAVDNGMDKLRYETIVLQGVRAYQYDNFQEAVTLLSHARQFRQDDTIVLLNRGRAYRELREFDRAITDFSEGIRLKPWDYQFFNERGVTYVAMDDAHYPQAISDYSEAIRLKPSDDQLFLNRASAYNYAGDYNSAVADYNGVIQTDPKNRNALVGRGVAYTGLNKFDEALRDFDDAIRIDPRYKVAFLRRAQAYAKQNDHSRAIADFSEAIRLDSRYAFAFCSRGKSKQKVGDTTAGSDIHKAVELGIKCT